MLESCGVVALHQVGRPCSSLVEWWPFFRWTGGARVLWSGGPSSGGQAVLESCGVVGPSSDGQAVLSVLAVVALHQVGPSSDGQSAGHACCSVWEIPPWV